MSGENEREECVWGEKKTEGVGGEVNNCEGRKRGSSEWGERQGGLWGEKKGENCEWGKSEGKEFE